MYVPFQEVKALANITQVAEWLKLNLRNNRTQCPRNEGDKREIAVTPEKNLYKCFGCNVGGDQISLAAHVLGFDQKKAAAQIMAHFHGYKPAEKGLPEGGLDYLEAKHEEVQRLGISEETARMLGVGFAPRGTMRGRVLFPLRDRSGKLLGYIGYNELLEQPLKLPSNLVVPLKS